MITNLMGMLQDGTNPVITLPTVGGRIEVPRGEILTVYLTVIRPNGSLVDLGTSTLLFSIKDRTVSSRALLSSIMTPAVARGQASVTFSSYALTRLLPAIYDYDVWLGDSCVVPLWPFVILDSSRS